MTGLLLTKLRRDLLRNWTQFTAVFLMAFLSVLCYTGLEGAWYGLQRELDSYAQDTSMADGWLYATSIDSEDLDRIRDVDGVEDVAPVSQLPVQQRDGDAVTGRLLLETASEAPISIPTVLEGPEPGVDADGVWLDRDYAEEHDIAPGDEIALSFAGRQIELPVTGILLSPDHIYYTGTPSLVAPAPDLYGYGVVSRSTLTRIAGVERPDTMVRVAGEVTELRNQAPDILAERYQRFTTQETNTDVSTAFDRVDQIRTLSILFSFIFILLSLLAMYTSVRRLAEMQKRDVATLKALGYSNRTIGLHFASYGFVTGGIGGLLGLAVAPAQSLFVLGTQKSMLALPSWSIAYTSTVAVVALLVATMCTIGAYTASRSSLRGMPADGMRDQTVTARRSPLERFGRWWNGLTYGTRWAVRDAGRNVVRMAMGVVAVAGCMMLLFAGFGMPDSMNGQVNDAFVEENTYTGKVFLTDPAAAAAVVEAASEAQLVTETVVATDPDDGFDRVLTVLDSGDYLHLFDTDGVEVAIEDGPYLSDGAARQLDIASGEDVGVRVPGSTSFVDVTVEGIVGASQPQGVFVGRAAWEALGQEFRPNVVLVGPDADLDAIAELPGVASVLEIEAQRTNATGLVNDLLGIFLLIRAFAILLAVIVLYSLGALSFTERTRDYATLSVLGFRPRDIRSLVMRENIGVTLVGLLVGIPAGLWFMGVYVGTFSTETITYTPSITPLSMAISIVLTSTFSLLTTFLLGRRIARIDMTGALKSVE